jgi:hypothetical protein
MLTPCVALTDDLLLMITCDVVRDRPSEIVQLSARGQIGPASIALRARISLAIASAVS